MNSLTVVENRRKRPALIYGAAVIIFLLLMLLSVQIVLANTRLDSNGEVPFYARFGQNETFHDGEWAVIVFYRPPGCIPTDFNLIQFFHFPGPGGPGAFACRPATTDGFEIWKYGPGIDQAPIFSHLKGKGAVPVWFISWPELQSAMSGGNAVTIDDLAGLSSLITGTATFYQETLQPTGAANNPVTNIVASGSLDGGGSFSVHATRISASGHLNTQITLQQ